MILRRQIFYTLKLELENERKEILLEAFYYKELSLVKKEIF